MDTHVTAAKIIEAATRVHRELGPGSLESVYLASLLIELKKMGMYQEAEAAEPQELFHPELQSRVS
jgi:GxxExxY protein